jgi:hypothetical protein
MHMNLYGTYVSQATPIMKIEPLPLVKKTTKKPRLRTGLTSQTVLATVHVMNRVKKKVRLTRLLVKGALR